MTPMQKVRACLWFDHEAKEAANFYLAHSQFAHSQRLLALDVTFTQKPVSMGPVSPAVFHDTCGNLIQIAQWS